MGQVTIYLDDQNEKRVKAAARAAGVSVSRWVANLVEGRTCNIWPDAVKELAGAWKDFPDLEIIRRADASDSTRETL